MATQLTWLEPGEPFPPPSQAWGLGSPAPGLLAGGGALDVKSLYAAYSSGIFPWFNEDQPILWWSPDPRMVLNVDDFKLHRSLRKALLRFAGSTNCEIRMDSAFAEVISACARRGPAGQDSTWIVPDMVQAYCRMHDAGFAHSVETWIDGQLVGGLYCVAIGRAVFGESMFSRVSDASKIALSALIAFCRDSGVRMIDCQQNTRHLHSLGAREISRGLFLERVAQDRGLPGPAWQFKHLYWQHLLTRETVPS